MTTLAIPETLSHIPSYIAKAWPYNARQSERVHPYGPCPFQGASTGIERRAGGKHIVNQEDRPPLYGGVFGGGKQEKPPAHGAAGLGPMPFGLGWGWGFFVPAPGDRRDARKGARAATLRWPPDCSGAAIAASDGGGLARPG